MSVQQDTPSQAKPYNFATLIPRNMNAILAFSDVWEHMRQCPMEYTHHRHFLDVSPDQRSLGAALNEPAADSTDDTELDAGSDHHPLDRLVWTGKFVFNLSRPPEMPPLGWRCGHGRRWEIDPFGRVDIVLCLPEDGKKHGIHPNHCFFRFLPATDAFAIQARHPTGVDADEAIKGRNDGIVVLNRPRQMLRIGQANYEFSYSVVDEDAFRVDRENYMRDILHRPSPPTFQLSTPSDNDIHVGKWRLLGRVGQGSESVVVSAMSSENQIVVVKTLNRLHFRQQDIAAEIRRNRHLTERVSSFADSQYVLAFLEGITNDQAAYLVFEPHARHDLNAVLQDPRAHNRRLLGQLFQQALRGVGALHAAGFMHRDLKPANIGVVRMDPPQAIVLDLGSAMECGEFHRKSDPGTIGTVGYLAPEMEDGNPKVYGTKVDVWAMGCVALELLLPRDGPRIPWNPTYTVISRDGTARTKQFNPWRSFETFTPPCPTVLQLETQRKTYKTTLDAMFGGGDPLEDAVAKMLIVPPHWRWDIASVLAEFEDLHVEDWPGQVAAGEKPQPVMRQPDQGHERGSIMGARKALRT
ncbi:unnamed protein product [Zymoseptoria tritici ST99CH_1E4]|uniref:cyclin-dependent kinase n=2 Tax=Zymoseptoria tritici TaxID=1047171 RepID=A0A2H1H944_ZYMTR|nr:unnamed protein product [Zymoseptoria tritici ST99CH_1E4]